MSRNRYVGDYRIVETLDERGRVVSRSEYTGKHYRFAEDDVTVRGARMWVGACCIVGWAAYVLALLPLSVATRTIYVSLPFVFAALPLALTSGTALSVFHTKPPFERRFADRLENRAPAATFFVMLLTGLSLAGECVNALRGHSLLWGDAAFSIGAAVLFACGKLAHGQWKRFKCVPTDAL